MARPPRSNVERALVGPAGEHYVLYQLYRHGMLASLAPPGTPTVDALVLATDQAVVLTVQVKTRTYGADGGWHMREARHIVEPRCFYAFVDLEPHPPATFIVPSVVVAEVLRIAHKGLAVHAGARRASTPHQPSNERHEGDHPQEAQPGQECRELAAPAHARVAGQESRPT